MEALRKKGKTGMKLSNGGAYEKRKDRMKLSNGGAYEKRKDRMKLRLSPNLLEKLVWLPVILLYEIVIPSYMFDALLCQNFIILAPKSRDFRDNSNEFM